MDVSALQTRIEALVADPSRGPRTKKGQGRRRGDRGARRGHAARRGVRRSDWITHAWIKHAILLYFARMDSVHIGPDCAQKDALRCREYSPTYYDKAPDQTQLQEARRALRARRDRPLRKFPRARRDPDARIREHRRVRRRRHDDRHLGDGRFVRADRQERAPLRRRRHRRRPRSRRKHRRSSSKTVRSSVRAASSSKACASEREAVLGAGVVVTGSTPIVDVRGSEPVITKGYVEPRSVVIPGTMPKRFPPASSASVRARHRHAQRIDRHEDLAQRRPARLRGRR